MLLSENLTATSLRSILEVSRRVVWLVLREMAAFRAEIIVERTKPNRQECSDYLFQAPSRRRTGWLLSDWTTGLVYSDNSYILKEVTQLLRAFCIHKVSLLFASISCTLKHLQKKQALCLCIDVKDETAQPTSLPLLLIFRIKLWNFLHFTMTGLWNWASLSLVYWRPQLQDQALEP